MAVLGHSGSHAPQLMHSSVMTVAMHVFPFQLGRGLASPRTRDAKRARLRRVSCFDTAELSTKSAARGGWRRRRGRKLPRSTDVWYAPTLRGCGARRRGGEAAGGGDGGARRDG